MSSTPARRPIDWEQIKQRLAQAEEALLRAQSPAPEARRAAMEARARAIALQTASRAQRGAGVEVVEFTLGGLRLAVEAEAVREVRFLLELTPIPCAPRFISGMMGAHGRVIAVIDLKNYMALPESGLTDLNKVIILQRGDREFGVLADRIVGGRWLPEDEMTQGPLPGAPAPRFVKALAGEGTALLDLDAIVRDPFFDVDEEVGLQ